MCVRLSNYNCSKNGVLTRNLEIIGEAARVLPDEIKQKTHSIEWYKIVALRNILIHEYFGVNSKLIWDVVQNKLEELETECKALL